MVESLAHLAICGSPARQLAEVTGRPDLDETNGMYGVSPGGAYDIEGSEVNGAGVDWPFVLRSYFILLGGKIPEKSIDRPVPLTLIRGGRRWFGQTNRSARKRKWGVPYLVRSGVAMCVLVSIAIVRIP